LPIVEALAGVTSFLKSKNEARRELSSKAISVNKLKVSEEYFLTPKDLMNGKYILLGKGKKTNFLLVFK
jgi:tyrosyl-tRNA synthetase